MARLPRLYVPDAVQYVAQAATVGRALVVDADDGAVLLGLLEAACRRYGFALHSYALTPSAIHLLGTPAGPQATSGILQSIGRSYVPRINRKTGVPGGLWSRRYRSTVVDPAWLLPVTRVIESYADATQPAWSSRAHHRGARADAFVTDHARYWALSDTPFGRQAAYRALAEAPVEPGLVERVERAVDHGWALGTPEFIAGIERLANRRATPLKRGRTRTRANDLSPI